MGPPVSVAVAEIVMQNIEEQVLATYTRTIPLRFRYVVYKDEIDDFHEHLNRQNTDIQFTKKIEENCNTAWSLATTTDYLHERHFTENHTHDLTEVTDVYR